jgi:hypothetical protein
MATRVSDIDASEVAVEVSRTWRPEEAGKQDADWRKWVQRVRDMVRGPVDRTFRIATPMIISAAFRARAVGGRTHLPYFARQQLRLAALHGGNNTALSLVFVAWRSS